MPSNETLVLPFIVEDNVSRVKHTVTELTDTSNGRLYWLYGKPYLASRFTILSHAGTARAA